MATTSENTSKAAAAVENSEVSDGYPTLELVRYNVATQDPIKCYPPRKHGVNEAWDRYCVYPLERTTIMPKELKRLETGLMVKSYPSDDYYLALTANEWAIRRGLVVFNTFQDDVLRVYPSDVQPLVFNSSKSPIHLETTDYYFEIRLMPKQRFHLKVDPMPDN